MQISCRQISTLSPQSWRVVISGDGQDRVIDLEDPFETESEDLVQWYLEDYAASPFTNYRASAAVSTLQNYRESLWQQLQINWAESTILSTPTSIDLSIIISKGQDDIDKLHWELLESFEATPCPSIIVHRVLQNDPLPTPLPYPRGIQIYESTLRILVVSARSNQKADLNPRLTSLPLVQTLGGDPRVKLDFVHTGTFEEFERILDQQPDSEKSHLVHFDLHGSIDHEKGPVLEFHDPKSKHRKCHTASSVAEVLRNNGVRWAVLCACRTAKITSTFSHLALEFMNHGVTGVFAMRYELKAAAARILTSSFYTALCRDGKTFIEAGHASRRAMQDSPSRPARFGERVKIKDSLVPAIYSVDGGDFRLANYQPIGDSSTCLPPIPVLLPELIGREDDIRQLSTLLGGESSFVVLSSDIGNGKSILMKHLAWWWRETKLFTRTLYVNVSLGETSHDKNTSTGILAIVRGIWRSVMGEDADYPMHSNPKANLFQAMEAAKGRDTVVILDGIDEVYYTSSETDDTSEKWAEFFHVAKLLSITGFKLLVATCTPLLLLPNEGEDVSFKLSVCMTAEEAWQYASSTSDEMMSEQSYASGESPDTHLHCTLEVLQYNRTALKSQSKTLRGKFHGLDTVLSWDVPFEEDFDGASLLETFRKKSTAPLSLDLSNDQGLGRTHHLMVVILTHLANANRYSDMCALISLGLWIDAVPHPDEILNIFDTEDISGKIPLLQYIMGNIPRPRVNKSVVPFELWSIMKENSIPGNQTSLSSKSDIAKSLKYAVRLLLAARLITGRTEPLVDGKKGYRLHSALTIWLRRIMRVLPRDVIFINFITCMEERASQMTDVNPDSNDLRLGNAKLLRAVESPSFNFVEREKWNLLTAVVGLTQKAHQFSSMGIELPSDVRRFAWASFIALSPISSSREDFCTWFLTHVALKSLKDLAPLVPQSHRDPLPPALTHFLLLILLNWVIWMTQKYRLDQKLAMPLEARRLLLARVQARKDDGIDCDELCEPDFAMAEVQAWLNERWIALGYPSLGNDEAVLNRIREKITSSAQNLERGWDTRVNLVDHLIQEFSPPVDNSLQIPEVPRDETGPHINSPPDHVAMTSLAMGEFYRSIMAAGKNNDNPTANAWILDILTFMETDIDFMSSMRAWYMHTLIPIFTHLRKGNISRAITAALSGLNVAERDGDTLLASNFRQLSRRLADLDTLDEYDVQQTKLSRTAEVSVPMLRDLLLVYLATHDTPGAYEHVKNERIKSEAMIQTFSILRKAMKGVSSEAFPGDLGSLWSNMPESDALAQIGLDGVDQLLGLLEPYKDAKLEDKKVWVRLIQQIWDLMDDLCGRNTPDDQAWILELYRNYPEPKQARDFWRNKGVPGDGTRNGHLHME